MAANIEVKARVTDRAQLESMIREISGEPVAILQQEDLFFKVPRGRLKLRCEDLTNCALIYYSRRNEPGPTLSTYVRTSLDDPEAKRRELCEEYGVQSVVQKTRRLFIVNGARIHLDDVTGLGTFVEIEVPVHGSPERNRATTQALRLMKLLSINREDVLRTAYEDLLRTGRDERAAKGLTQVQADDC